MRKSNFFNFVISMYDNTNHPVEVHRAVFKDFYDTTTVSSNIYCETVGIGLLDHSFFLIITQAIFICCIYFHMVLHFLRMARSLGMV